MINLWLSLSKSDKNETIDWSIISEYPSTCKVHYSEICGLSYRAQQMNK